MKKTIIVMSVLAFAIGFQVNARSVRVVTDAAVTKILNSERATQWFAEAMGKSVAAVRGMNAAEFNRALNAKGSAVVKSAEANIAAMNKGVQAEVAFASKAPKAAQAKFNAKSLVGKSQFPNLEKGFQIMRNRKGVFDVRTYMSFKKRLIAVSKSLGADVTGPGFIKCAQSHGTKALRNLERYTRGLGAGITSKKAAFNAMVAQANVMFSPAKATISARQRTCAIAGGKCQFFPGFAKAAGCK